MNLETEASPNTLHPAVIKLIQKRWGKFFLDFLSWDLKQLPDITQMLDLELAAKRIIKAIKANETIGIYGDYDVDGTTSCALLAQFFSLLDVKVELIQPSRFIEGYGLHVSSIVDAKEKKIKVLITVDCGITSNEAADYALLENLDLIITDHHKDASPTMPKAFAVINPNRRDETCIPDLKTLAGVGVAFALAVKIRQLLIEEGQKIPSLYPLLSYVAIGTISDMAYLSPTNLKLCRHGLKSLAQTSFEGLKVFFTPEERNVPFIVSEKISFNIGPLINAKGRLDHPELALKLLLASTHQEAIELYHILQLSNKERKFIQQEVFLEAKEQVIKNLKTENPLIHILFAPHWHEGVVGIVAAKIVEAFSIPAIVLTSSDKEGIIKGSARTAGDLNIFDYLYQCQDLFLKFGGHQAAAGLSMQVQHLEAFKEKMDQLLKPLPYNLRSETFLYDQEIHAHDVNAKLVRDLELLEPFGQGNEKPIFKLSKVKINSFRILKDQHVKWFFSALDDSSQIVNGISFNYLNQWKSIHPEELFKEQKNQTLNVFGTIGINRFNGNETIQFQVIKIELGF
jgi:single-stranded-DNA-specific exonuclease